MNSLARPSRLTIVPAEVLDRPIVGSGLFTDASGHATLRRQLHTGRATLVVMLRHAGCLFCSEMIKDLRTTAELADGGGARRFPRAVFLHQTTPAIGERLMGRFWPGAIAISDPDRTLTGDLFDLAGGLGHTFHAKAARATVRALLKGHRPRRPRGRILALPGLVMLMPPTDESGGAAVVWRFEANHIGDRPDYATLPGIAEAAPTRPAAPSLEFPPTSACDRPASGETVRPIDSMTTSIG